MGDFSEDDIDLVWSKGRPIDGRDASQYRLDVAGALMKRDDYGENSLFGWEIDHIFPKQKLKDNHVPESKWDNIINLRPMNSSNNASKGDDYPDYSSVVKYDEKEHKNKDVSAAWEINSSLQDKLARFFGLKSE